MLRHSLHNVSYFLAKSTMKLENLFPGQKTLAKVADDFLNSEQFVEMVERSVKPFKLVSKMIFHRNQHTFRFALDIYLIL